MLVTEGYILIHTLKEHNKVINKPLQENNAREICHNCLRPSILFFAQLKKIIIVIATLLFFIHIII